MAYLSSLDTHIHIETFYNCFVVSAVTEGIRRLCLDFIVGNFKDVTQTSKFADLPQHLMLEIIQESAKQLSVS